MDKKSNFFYWETNVTNLDLLKMKSVTKTLQAPSPTSTKAYAWPDPSFSTLQKNNHVKNPGSTSGLLSHTATPSTPPSIDTHPPDQQAESRPKEGIVRFPQGAGNHSYTPTWSKIQVSKGRQKEDPSHLLYFDWIQRRVTKVDHITTTNIYMQTFFFSFLISIFSFKSLNSYSLPCFLTENLHPYNQGFTMSPLKVLFSY